MTAPSGSFDKNMSILVIDDYPSMRRIVKNCLRQLGFDNVTEADTGQAALEQLKGNNFQFIISDFSIPDMTPDALLGALKSESKVPIVMIAAEQERGKACELGGAAVIVKPFTRDILQRKMEEAQNQKSAT